MNWWKVCWTTAILNGVLLEIDNNSCSRVTAFFPPQNNYHQRKCESSSNSNGYCFTDLSMGVLSDLHQRRCCETTAHSKSSTILFVGGTGWDNENFLESLSKGSDAINKANEEYKQQSRFTNMRPSSADDDDDDDNFRVNRLGSSSTDDDIDDGVKDATLSKDQIERIKKQNDEESGGGEAFKRLLERAQQGSTLKEIMPPPPPPPPASDTSTTAQPVPALPEGFEKLSVEAQAALFRQLMSSPPITEPIREQWPAAPGPRPEAKGQAMLAADGRKIGRNRDADALVNTADVYFAQLKLDSATRNSARMQGDDETANAVFSNPKIPEVKLHINPYMEEQRKKELAMIETAADEMFTPEILSDYKKEVDVTSRGVSFKELLEQKRKAAAQQKQQPQQVRTGTTSQSPVAPTNIASTKSPPVRSAIPPPPPPQAASAIESPTIATSKSEDETRRDIRTLMGLLIKHRGGPGFGAGRIVGNEMERFASLTKEVVDMLREEASNMPPENTPSRGESPTSRQLKSTNPSTSSSNVMTQAPQPKPGDRINSALTCIDGAITMYRNAPPELQPSVLVTLRAALLSAISTINEVLASTPGAMAPTSATSSPDVRIHNALACIDGAITMYRNAPPELQPSVLITLRAALLSAVNTCNDIVTENESEGISGSISSSYSTPNQLYDDTLELSEPNSLPTSASVQEILQFSTERSDENAAFLESVYQKLKDAAGDGKMGLRQDLDATKAEELANDISRMRALLVEELNGSSRQTDTTSQPPAAAQYKQMLAKVRADKDAAGNN